jgi:hypothetical protein
MLSSSNGEIMLNEYGIYEIKDVFHAAKKVEPAP